MTVLLAVHHLTSALLVLSCWWVAHEYARDKPPGRMIAVGWSALGFITLLGAFMRHLGMAGAGSWMLAAAKLVLVLTLAGLILRFVRRRRAEARGDLSYPHEIER